MAYIYYNIYGKVNLITSFLKKDKLQDMNINQLKLEVHDTYKKDERIKKTLNRIILKTL